MIYCDRTEAREGSRLPQNVIDQAKVLPGLEAATGADLLITTLKIGITALPPVESCHAIIALDMDYHPLPVLAKLAGCTLSEAHAVIEMITAISTGLLVQRKTGQDLLGSIPVLPSILNRMLMWTTRPWLLFIGSLKEKGGRAVVDRKVSGFSYNAAQGALDSWQLCGGYVTFLPSDDLVAGWCSRWHDKLRSWSDEVVVREPEQTLLSRKYPWVNTLCTLPGVGEKNARAFARHYGTLSGCVEALTDRGYNRYEAKPDGATVGKKTVESIREWFGLGEEDTIAVIRR